MIELEPLYLACEVRLVIMAPKEEGESLSRQQRKAEKCSLYKEKTLYQKQ